MSTITIAAEHLAKRYSIQHQSDARDGLRHSLENALRSPFQWLKKRRAVQEATREDFWALKNVSFEIQQGDIVGIVGRNGAGKSTLLKVLSRITEPTEGRIRIRGRVASLLEVGTGFHQELTGRENIFLNGAILGMSKAEIRNKFDEIVAFSEVEKFLDTPVKRYSSGMYVRLAFAVAAHLEPEILIIDEVLAVGDAQFQKKCLGKIEGINGSGRTVLFVSHQIPSVTRLCRKVIWLKDGQLQEFGNANAVCAHYLSSGANASNVWDAKAENELVGNEWVRLLMVEARSEEPIGGAFAIHKPLRITVQYQVLKSGKVLIPNVHLFNEDGTLIFVAHDWYSGWRSRPKPAGRYATHFDIPGHLLSEGRVHVKAVVTTYQPFEVHADYPDAVTFNIVDVPGVDGARGDFGGHFPGVIRPVIPTVTECLSETPLRLASV